MRASSPAGAAPIASGDFGNDIEKGCFVPVLLSIAGSTRALFDCRLARLGLGASSMARMANELMECCLIERVGSCDDARATVLRIALAGELMRDAVERVWHEVTAEMERTLGDGFGAVMKEMHVLDQSLSAKLPRRR